MHMVAERNRITPDGFAHGGGNVASDQTGRAVFLVPYSWR